MNNPTAARRAAFDLLRDVARGAPFDAARDRHLTTLQERDRRLAYEMAAGVLRHRDALDGRLAPHVRRGWSRVPAELQDILRIGAYQLDVLERVPPYAAVSTTVALARSVLSEPAARFVNAILRRYGKGGPRPPSDESEGDPAAGLARHFSHPVWLIRRWYDRFGDETAALLEWNNTPPSVTLQPLLETNEALLADLRESHVAADRAAFGMGVDVGHAYPPALPGFRDGRWIVQDSAQAMAVRFAAVPSGALVYDACAAPGGKSVCIARTATVVAGDIARHRVSKLADTIRRVRSRARPIVADALHAPIAAADVVLLDAPCSATGTLRRHPDARRRLSARRIHELARNQARLLDGLAPVVRSGGLLVYVTCSLEPEENTEQVRKFLERHPAFERAPAPADLPPEALTAAGDLELLPHRHGVDGVYAARLKRGR